MQRQTRYTLALVLAGAFQLWASPTGSVTGFAKDPSGAVVPAVKITLTNTATNARLTTTSDHSGAYRFPQLPPATYSLVAEGTGFKKASIASVLVEVDQITHADIALEVGNVTDVVEVSGAAPLLESDKSTLSNVVDSRTISNMPLNSRRFLDLALVTPGAQPAAPGAVGGFSFAGARTQANNFQIDGISNMVTSTDVPLNDFRITDAVQEFAVQTSVALPEFGRGTGAQINIVTKSGTNSFHGSAFEYFRNAHLDAADFFTNRGAATKAPLNRNQFGSTLGGPIVKDRTFFFLSYEGFQQVAPQVSSTRVPTVAERATVTDPISRRLLEFWPAANATGTANYVGNVPSRASDNTGLIRIDHNFARGDRLTGRWIEFQGSTVAAGSTPISGGNLVAAVSRSFVLAETHAFTPTFLNEIRLGYSRNQSATTAQDEGFNAAPIFTDAAGKPLAGVIDGAKDPLHSGLPTISVAGGFAPLGSVFTTPGGGAANTYELFENVSLINPFGRSRHSWRWGFHIRREETNRSFQDSNSRGSFTFVSFPDFAAGRVNTATIRTGSTVTYLRRYPWDLFWQDQYKVKQNFTLNYGIRYEYPSVASEIRNNAINFIPGIGPMIAGTNQILDIDPSKKGPSSIFFRQAPFTVSAGGGVRPDKNNFAPVLGFAYSPRFATRLFGHDATVIRGGFRVGYDDIQSLYFGVMPRNAPHSFITTQTANLTQPARFPWGVGFNQDVSLISNFGQQGPGTATVGLVQFQSLGRDFRSAYLYQWNFGIQRRLGREFSIEVDYQGSEGHKLAVTGDLNQPAVIVRDATVRGPVAHNEQIFPYNHFAGISNVNSIGNSNYHGMVATGKFQGRKGIFFQGSYTLGKSIDDGSASSNSGLGDAQVPNDNTNRRLERGPSSFDVRHRAVFVYGVELPVGPGHRFLGWKNGFNRQAFGGWQISGITTLQTGAPFTVVTALNGPDFSGFNSSFGNKADRPDVTRSGPLPQDNRNPDAALNTTYFKVAPPGRAGTSGRNQYYGPGVQNYDFAAAKSFPLFAKLGEQTRLQFRADFFNLFNHTNFANPGRDLSNAANFGKITQTLGSAIKTTGGAGGVTGGPLGGSRLIQLSLRLQF